MGVFLSSFLLTFSFLALLYLLVGYLTGRISGNYIVAIIIATFISALECFYFFMLSVGLSDGGLEQSGVIFLFAMEIVIVIFTFTFIIGGHILGKYFKNYQRKIH